MNKLAGNEDDFLFAGDYELVGLDPAWGFDVVAGMGAGMVFIHFHHRHEFQGGANKGLWGTVKGTAWGIKIIDNSSSVAG